MQNCQIELSKSLKMFHEFVSFTWPQPVRKGDQLLEILLSNMK